MPAVVFKSKFVVSTSKEFKSYIDYINRDEAIRNEAYRRYSLYNDYMGNPEKTTGIFTSCSNRLMQSEKDLVKEKFDLAQKNKSLMWQEVYSFNNKWLEEQGLYDPKTKYLDEDKIKNAIRKSIDYSLEKTNIKESSLWSGAIHFNTDNIHIHVAICEPIPTQKRGKRTQKTIDTMKSKFINELLDFDIEYKKINELIRENLVNSTQSKDMRKDKEMKKIVNDIIKNLPMDKRHWHYNYNTMKDAREHIDKLTEYYIKTYKYDDYIKLVKELDKQEKRLLEIYGKGARKKFEDYKKNKIDEMYSRMGNRFLREIKQTLIEEERKNNLINYNKNMGNLFTKKDINNIENALGNEFDNMKNQSYYKQLQREIEYS